MGYEAPKYLTLIPYHWLSIWGLKDVDVPSKFKSLHLNWLNRLYDENYHPWKQIPLYYLEHVSKNFNLFHPNLLIPKNMLNNIPMFYQNIINFWQDISYFPPTTVNMILSESLCFNSFIKIDNLPILPSFFDNIDQVYLSHLFTDDGVLISWAEASEKLKMRNFFKWAQIAHAIPSNWKSLVRNSTFDRGTCCLDQHLIKSEKMLPVDKLNSRIFYDVLVVKLSSPPISQKYFERQFGHNLKWVDIYRLPHLVTSDSRTRFFQFKLSHNILPIN